MWEQLLNDVPTFAFALYAVLIVIEVSVNLIYKLHLYKLNDTLCSLSMGMFYVVTRGLMQGTMLAMLYFAHQFALFDIASNWWTFVGAYILGDLCVYAYHRFVHEVRFGWAAHICHHSSQQYNLGATAFRQSFVEPFIEPFFFLPLAFLGFDPLIILVALEVNLIYMFWVHLEKVGKLHPWFEFWFSTPSHHRVHHSANVQYLDKNYGGTFIIWDRLFGTFEEEREKPVYGIAEQLDTHNPIKASLHSWQDLAQEVREAQGLTNKLKTLVMPPGWKADGTGMTTRRKQALYAAGALEQ